MFFSCVKSFTDRKTLLAAQKCLYQTSFWPTTTFLGNKSIGREMCTVQSGDNLISEETSIKKGGFAKAYEKFATQETSPISETNEPTFLSLLKSSKFIDVSFPKLVVAKIVVIIT